MLWIDLAVLTYLLWGGALGYIHHLRHSVGNLIVIIMSIGLAHLYKGNLVALIKSFSPLDNEIKRVISSHMIVPVEGNIREGHEVGEVGLEQMLLELEMPPQLQEVLLYKLHEQTPGIMEQSVPLSYLSEFLTEVSLNVIGFSIALILWVAWLNIGKSVIIYRLEKRNLLPLEAWYTSVLGVFVNFLLIGMFSGFISISSWLSPTLYQLLDLNSSLLIPYSLYVYNWLGCW